MLAELSLSVMHPDLWVNFCVKKLFLNHILNVWELGLVGEPDVALLVWQLGKQIH